MQAREEGPMTNAASEPGPEPTTSATFPSERTPQKSPRQKQYKNILLSGEPRSGKTTLVRKLVEELKSALPGLRCQGFYTEDVRVLDVRVGFDAVLLDGSRLVFARKGQLPGGRRAPSHTEAAQGSTHLPSMGNYVVDVPSFEQFAVPELTIKPETQLMVIDEIGKMESFSRSFMSAVGQALDSSVPVLGTIPSPAGHVPNRVPAINVIRNRSDVKILPLKIHDRDRMYRVVYNQLLERLKSS